MFQGCVALINCVGVLRGMSTVVFISFLINIASPEDPETEVKRSRLNSLLSESLGPWELDLLSPLSPAEGHSVNFFACRSLHLVPHSVRVQK